MGDRIEIKAVEWLVFIGVFCYIKKSRWGGVVTNARKRR